MKDYSRAELLALTPAKYLADGYLDGQGKPKTELKSNYATAAATQFLAAQLSPQELAFTYEALKQCLALQTGTPSKKMTGAVDEALEVVSGMIRQRNNPGLSAWLKQCAAAVRKPAEPDALLEHVLAILRQYSIVVAAQKA